MKKIVYLILLASAIAQQTSETITTAPATPTAGILRPSSGETITVGQPYTVRWTPPPPEAGPLAIELFGWVNRISQILPNTTSCDGWLINTQCDKLDVNISSGSTSYVWDLSKPDDDDRYRLPYEEMSLRMGIYEDNLSRGDLPRADAPWYLSASFALARETTTRTASTTTTTTASTTTTSTGPEATDGADSSDDSATPTDAAVLVSPQMWTVVTAVGAWTFLSW
ncbi:hypothetical protein ASPVEDRAFT_40732 [Aspergillus versicolor CBS 583.65]|uniref:Uncharacterized protein n=1 Tax=Aspergillus versicolor CBS 583.65 TaxID=1036611 RepID=A0A1L9PI99_ASPVE|nr:uncharacterized protein ASPVEDRAFT_40732 [Aspergillus versicolor CBS 583.65]OJJ01176.1 hypothetical protein ASPVEDRAFT_40732 [Aspergillus versicolor CBS 583.65]